MVLIWRLNSNHFPTVVRLPIYFFSISTFIVIKLFAPVRSLFLNLNTALDWRRDNINLQLVRNSRNFYVNSQFSRTSRLQLHYFKPILICQKLNVISFAVYCSSDYSLFFLLMMTVCVANSSHSVTICFSSGITTLLGWYR